MKLLLPLLAVGLIAGHGPARANRNSISDSAFCFYENSKIEEVYGTDNTCKIDQVLNISGIDWVFSNFAYGLDNPVHQQINYEALYCDMIWGSNYNLDNASLDNEGGAFYLSEYKNDYKEILSNRLNPLFACNSIIMSKDYFEADSIDDITLFTRFSTGELGVVMMVQPEGENWRPLYTAADSHFMSHYAGTIDDLIDDGISNNFAPAETIYVDGYLPYTRYFDSYCMYDDAKYNNIPNKPFKFAFVFQSIHSYQLDFILDGIMVNKKVAMKNYLNGILDKNICGAGFDENLVQSFKMFDKIADENDIEYLSNEFHDDGATSYYETYKYLYDKINNPEGDNSLSSNGLNLILNGGLNSYYNIVLVVGLGLASIGVYYLILKRKTKQN